ncbi:ABC transporter ATP-binding protein [Roseateles sp. GG27B]
MEIEDKEELIVRQANAVLGGRQVLRGIDLAVAKGQLLALLGASGCGKTTLLRAIAGLAELDGGQILIAGRDVTGMAARERGVGVVFQHYALFPNLSVLENVKFGLLAGGQSAAAATARAGELLELVELESHAAKLPGQLSGGQRQRVALARALARKPSLLLMDEPFSALDESFRLPLRRSFRRLQRELGQTCLLVTHDREEAYELADQVAVMFDGGIAQCCPPHQLWQTPASRRVADFLGAFNRFDACLAPGALQRAGGSWIAPIESLQISSDQADASADAWIFSAELLACHASHQSRSLELRTAQGELLVLSLTDQRSLPPLGAQLTLSIPAQALRYLAD